MVAPVPPVPDYVGDLDYLPELPRETLARYGARLLDPTVARVVPEQPVPLPTVYRADTLMVPAGALRGDGRALVDRALAGANLRLVVPDVAGVEDEMFVPVRLEAFGGTAVLDAWAAVQEIRVAAADDDPDDRPPPTSMWSALLEWLRQLLRRLLGLVFSPRGPLTHIPVLRSLAVSTRHLVDRIHVEHLLLGAEIVLGGAPGPYQGVGPDPDAGIRVSSWGPGQLPVTMVAAAPARRDPKDIDSDRRPVIAVIDSGIARHPWLTGYVSTDQGLQARICKAGQDAAAKTSHPRPVILDVMDGPPVRQALLGTLNTCYGHGTFITGLLRQLAPDAEVLAVRVMQADGIAYESDVCAALNGIRERVTAAQDSGTTDGMVDVVSLSLGYYDERGVPDLNDSALAQAIAGLTQRGVLVVAAAGNQATLRPFLPAALATVISVGNEVMASVGAMNPTGSTALFSNGIDWVTHLRRGTALVSTMPIDGTGGLQPRYAVPPIRAVFGDPQLRPRESFDQDDFSGGFAVSSGTSFAAPLVAAELANGLINFGPICSSAEDCKDHTVKDHTIARARKVLARMKRIDP
jgi:hypothetical protein